MKTREANKETIDEFHCRVDISDGRRKSTKKKTRQRKKKKIGVERSRQKADKAEKNRRHESSVQRDVVRSGKTSARLRTTLNSHPPNDGISNVLLFR